MSHDYIYSDDSNSTAHIIPCPFCNGAGLTDDSVCRWCEGSGQAWADHGEHVGHGEACQCDECVKSRANFDAWVADTDARWDRAYRSGKVAHVCSERTCNGRCPQSLTDYSGIVMEARR